MTIPPKIILSGNEGAASAFVGLGKKNLRTLQKDMSFQSLPTGKVIRQIDEFTQIEVLSRYGESVINITSTAPEEEPPGGAFSCFCECGVSVGAEINMPNTPDYSWDATGPKDSPVWKDISEPTRFRVFENDYYESLRLDISFCRLDRQARNIGTFPFDWFDYRKVDEVYGVVPERAYYIPWEPPIRRKLVDAYPCNEDGAEKYKRERRPDIQPPPWDITIEDDLIPISLEVQGAHRTIYV